MLTGVRVLIVEDEPLVALDVESSFRAAGASTMCGRSIQHALDLIEAGSVDFAVLDTRIWNGATSDVIADLLVAKAIPFAVFSAYQVGRPEAIARVPKPMTSDAVVKVAEAYLNLTRGAADETATLALDRPSARAVP